MIAAERVSLRRAAVDERPLIAQMIQLYLHDFSEFAPLESDHGELGDDGLFAQDRLAAYWTDTTRAAYLHTVDGRLAGFVLVNNWSASGRPVNGAIAEFCVLRKYRRHGLGATVARRAL